MRTGGFTRNKFLTLYIWPSGNVGWVRPPKPICSSNHPDEFLDFVPEEWVDETPPPCRSSYPSSISILEFRTALRRIPHPVQRSSQSNAHRIIHGNNREVAMEGGSCSQADQQRACPESFSPGQRKVWESRGTRFSERRHGGRTSALLDSFNLA